MNKENYIGIELAKQLKEWGCDVHSTEIYEGNTGRLSDGMLGGDVKDDCWTWHEAEEKTKDVYAYSYYNIMVTYANEFFGEKKIKTHLKHRGGRMARIPEQVLYLLQQGKQKEADLYIAEHTVFNPLNK